jgi:hypothetical protein
MQNENLMRDACASASALVVHVPSKATQHHSEVRPSIVESRLQAADAPPQPSMDANSHPRIFFGDCGPRIFLFEDTLTASAEALWSLKSLRQSTETNLMVGQNSWTNHFGVDHV